MYSPRRKGGFRRGGGLASSEGDLSIAIVVAVEQIDEFHLCVSVKAADD